MIGVGTPALPQRRLRSPISPSWSSPGCSRRASRAPRGCGRFWRACSATRVEIEEFVGAWLTLEPSERTRLGAANSRARRRRDCAAAEHVQRRRQVPRPRLRARHRAFRAVPAGLAAGARDRRRDLPLPRRGIRLGHGARDSRRPDHARSRWARAPSSAGRAGWRRTGRRPTRRSAGTRVSTSSAASTERRKKPKAN